MQRSHAHVGPLPTTPEALLRPEASSFHTSGMKPREKPKRGTAVTVTAERAYKIIRAQLEEEGIAYAPGSYNDYVSRCFYHTNRYGVPQADAEAWASGLSRLFRASGCCPS